VEVLINTPLASDLILKGEVHALKELMKKSNEQGMKTFDQALYDLFKENEITLDDALRNADSPNEVRLMAKLGEDDIAASLTSNLDGLSLQIDADEKPSGMRR
jgi:twitching motility protein PilU